MSPRLRVAASRCHRVALPRLRVVLPCLLLAAFCLLPSVFSSLAQNEQPQPSPTVSPVPSPSPSPTPPPNLHQWGAVTSFHGLPSDRTHAIAQTEFGVTWFATDGGLARYDGRRTNAINAEGLPSGRVLALKADSSGALWVGTDTGAARLANGKFETIKETTGKVITAILTRDRDRAIMVSESGQIFDCQVKKQVSSASRPGEGIEGLTFIVRTLPVQPLQSADKDHPGPLKLTSLALMDEKLYVGTQSRGILVIENGEAREVVSKPRSYFINALETDTQGRLWAGVKVRIDDSGLLDNSELMKPAKAGAATGPVMALTRGAGGDMWVGTDGRGAFHFQNGKAIEHFTFESTGGALRSDHIFGVFVDPEKVVWFATDKGVCRFDPQAMRVENIAGDPNANYVRTLFRTSQGRLFAGTNAGLFTNDASEKKWTEIPEIGRRIIYALGEDKTGRILAATANGLFASSSAKDSQFIRLPASSDRLPQGDNVRSIVTINGATYVATFGYGVERLQGSQRTHVWPDAAADNHLREVTSLGKDGKDRLLIGTVSAGLFFFDGRQTSTEDDLDKLKGGAIWSILADDSDTWLGTDKGLYLFQSGRLKEIVQGVNARTAVLAPNTAPDNHQAQQLWCATVGNGLLKIAIDDQFGAIVTRLDVEQGLPSQRVFAVLSRRNADGFEEVILGTNRGVVRYEPGYVMPTVLPARIISQRIHQQAELNQGLQLDYPQNSLLLDVTAISSRTFPEQFQYAFLLADSKGKVIKQKLSRDSQFTMEGLKPGKYKATVRAFTKDLVASNPLSFELNVAGAPFPWTSTALAVLLILALLALTWAVLERRRIARTSAALVAANRELAGARLDLANEAERERRRIARDLHDQTLADLRRLLLITDSMPTTAPAGSAPSYRRGDNETAAGNNGKTPFEPAAFRKEIESVSNEIRRICEDLSPSVLDNVGLAAALEWALASAVAHLPAEKKFEYEMIAGEEIEERIKLEPGERIQIYRIAQEIINNICRHSQAAHVRLTLETLNPNNLTMTIEDDGEFFAPSDGQVSGRGLANIHARASLIEAEVAWTKRASGGTMFTLTKNERPATTGV